MWQTLQPGFDSIVEWWENIKGRNKELCVKHGVRLARERRDRLHNFIRSREKLIESGEHPRSYFHKSEKANARYKHIKDVRNREGNVVLETM